MRAILHKHPKKPTTLCSQLSQNTTIPFGPFNNFTQRRWKKPANTAQTRLENRTGDLKLDRVASQTRKLNIALHLFDIMSKRKCPFVSVQIMSRWASVVGISVGVGVGEFVRGFPHVFEVFVHPSRRNVCCRVREGMVKLVREEERVVGECAVESVRKLKKLMMMSKNGTLHLHALRLVSRELGLPRDFRESILRKFEGEFKLVDSEVVGLVERDGSLAVEEVEKWREREYREKWLSEFETKYAFPVSFPTGFRIEKGFRGKLKNWQRMPFVKPYEKEGKRSRTSAGIERFEKRVVGILHELLSLTIEKMMDVERIAHFRKDLGIEVNVRELLLKHPGIFYISTKGNTQTVFLREAYHKGCLVEPNPIYVVRRKMLDLMLLGRRNSKELKFGEVSEEEGANEEESATLVNTGSAEAGRDGDWMIPLLESSND